MGIAPNPSFPERPGTVFERKLDTQNPSRRGPLRFEEGVATDTDVPRDFEIGMRQGWETPPGSPNHNMPVHTKTAQETMQERAHVGSAAWVESQDFLGEFAQGSFTDYAFPRFEEKYAVPGRRPNPATVND